MFHQAKKILPALFLIMTILPAFADNGSVAHAYPLSDIKVDADLSDWPENLQRYPIHYYRHEFSPESDADISGYFTIGYNLSEQSLYVAVVMIDDIYIRSTEHPTEWWAHDMQVLYLDPQHHSEGAGVLGLEVNEYFRKIIDQEFNWDPFVKNAQWEDYQVEVLRTGDKTIYEWKLHLDGYIKEGRSLGFDYVVFDKDSENGETNTVGWGKDDGNKHECSACLGDVILMPAGTNLSEVAGEVRSSSKVLPKTVRFTSVENAALSLQAAVDSLGNYKVKLLPGKYTLDALPGLVETDDKWYRLQPEGALDLQVLQGKQTIVTQPLVVKLIQRPDMLPEKGILHDFDLEKQKELHEFIAAYQEYYNIPGVSLALIKDGKTIYTNTFGVKNMASQEPVVENTHFEAASITKPVFAYVVLRLAERGIIDLDKPLHEYLAFDDLEQYPEYKKMTARHVLIHRSGLPNWGRELQATPGTKYGYSGEGFEYLKRVVVSILGKKIDDIVANELIQPLGLYHMEFSESDILTKVVATGHINGSPTVQMIPKEAGMAWSMYTEAKAFSNFALALLKRKGLKPETYQEMMEIHTPYPDEDKENIRFEEGMGLGIALKETDFGKVFGHGGNNGDFKCHFEVYEDLGMGFVAFTNSNTGDELLYKLPELLIEGKEPEKTAHGSSKN